MGVPSTPGAAGAAYRQAVAGDNEAKAKLKPDI